MRVHTITPQDVPAYRQAVRLSQERIRPWNPVNVDDLDYHLRMQSSVHRSFLVRALDPDPEAGHDVVGKVNVTNVVRGRAHSGAMGYDSYDPYAGLGLFADGLRLVIDCAFEPEPHGMGLHRLEAAVQPRNTRSAGLLRSLGLRPRGAWPDYLWLADAHGAHDWRDHVIYGVTRTEWPAFSYATTTAVPPLVLLETSHNRAHEAAVLELVADELGAAILTLEAVTALDARAPRVITQARAPLVMEIPTGAAPRILADAGRAAQDVVVLKAEQLPRVAQVAWACAVALEAVAAVARPRSERR